MSIEHRPPISPPDLPLHDPDVPIENAVITRLSGNWGKRAAVKRPESDLLEFFEPDRLDCPESLLPFRDHPGYLRLPEKTQRRLHAWGWIAFNKNVMDIEQHVVNPGFAVLAEDAFGTGLGDKLTVAATQAMVDEQYHTLMHFNASAATRAGRGWDLPERDLPLAHKVRSHARALDEAGSARDRALTGLGYMTVAEISINAFLELVAGDKTIQPINRTTAELHSRDEYCHSSVAAELATIVFEDLDPADRTTLLHSMARAMEAFAATDFTTWTAVLQREGIPEADRIIADVRAAGNRQRILQDFRGLRKLCQSWDVVDALPFDWSTTISQ